MNPKIAEHQANICAKLIQEIDRLVVEEHRPADQYLRHVYRQHPEYGSRDRNFYSDAVFSWFRWRGWLKTPGKENIALAILMDALEIQPQVEYLLEGSGLPMTDIKPAGAMETEEKSEYLRGILQTPQRSEAATFSTCSRGTPLPRSLNFNYNELLPSCFFDLVFVTEHKERDAHLKQCIETFQTRPPTWLRLPSGREEGTLKILLKAGYEIGQHLLIKQAVFVKGAKKFDATQFPAIAVQDLASQCVGLCCNPKAEESWWDMCAGSGGKSLHLADLTHDQGSILATDVRTAILDQLSKRLQKNKYRFIKPLLWDGKSDPCPGKNFDGILIDAPCSGIGTWHRNPDARWRMDSGQIAQYAGVQKNLLETAAPKLKTDGRLVYSTCTLTRMENIDLISGFLEQHHEFRLEKLINPFNHEPSNGIIWIWPWEGCNGMFVAVMRKG